MFSRSYRLYLKRNNNNNNDNHNNNNNTNYTNAYNCLTFTLLKNYVQEKIVSRNGEGRTSQDAEACTDVQLMAPKALQGQVLASWAS